MNFLRHDWLCRKLGHWIVVIESYYDDQMDDVFTRWTCSVCGKERVSRSAQVEGAKERQNWVVVMFIVFLVWLPLFLL